jgi:hypothetical protein
VVKPGISNAQAFAVEKADTASGNLSGHQSRLELHSRHTIHLHCALLSFNSQYTLALGRFRRSVTFLLEHSLRTFDSATVDLPKQVVTVA